MAAERETGITHSSGNIFADLGFPDAEERKAKVRVIVQILRIFEERKLSDRKAASLLGITTLKILALKDIAIDDFTLERLLHFANALDYDVLIQLKQRPASTGSARVVVEMAA